MLPSWIRSRNDIPRPMYFFAIDTTSRRLAEVSCSRASRPMTHDRALPVTQLGVERDLGVVAHQLEQVGIVAGEDPALERRVGDVLAGPVPDRPQTHVVARVEVAVVDGQERPVQEGQEGLGRWCLVVGVDELLRLLEALLGPLRLGIAAGLDQVEIGRGDQQIGRRRVRERPADEVVGLIAERQPMLRLRGPGLALGVVEGPLVERDHRPSRAPRPAARRARWPWPGRPPPRRSAGRPCRSP